MGNCLICHDPLEDINAANALPYISLSQIRKARVLRVIDGDTVEIGFVFHGRKTRQRLRLFGIDAEEMRSPEMSVRVRAGVQKDILREAVEGKIVALVATGETDNFGRLLGYIRTEKHGNLSDYMISTGGCRRR